MAENLQGSKKKKKSVILITRLLVALVIALGLCEFPLENLESFLYDIRVRLKPSTETSGMVQTVVINKQSLDRLSAFPNPDQYVSVLRNIEKQNPAAIVVLRHPDDVKGTEEEIQRYARALRTFEKVYFPGTWSDYYAKSLSQKLYLAPPFSHVKLSMGAVITDKRLFALDSVSRSFLTTYYDQEMLHVELARKLTGHEGRFRGQFDFFFSSRVYIDYRPRDTYQPIPFENVLAGDLEPGFFTNKIVIVGDDSASSSTDYAFTPYSREPLAMSKMEIHANMFDTLILNSAPIRLPVWADKVITSIISAFTIYVVMAFNPAVGLITLFAMFISFTLLCYLLLAFAGIWIVMIHPFLAMFICYYFSIPYRLIVENRRSWEYFQKHKLLKQVEELKTNFLSMMSHDIKTPIARIQGMSEILLKERSRLSDSQMEAVETVQSSAEELSGFISTVLDLGRIENQKVQLKKQSKDINALLKEVISKHEFLAKEKNVHLIPELEPLFSVKIDVELMRQVFANLVENAIKYSPSGSKVLISSEEIGDSVVVQVADQGQGIPPDEIDNIFMKFYRSKNAKSSPIKGSGLGLYLAKYFVELHGGSLVAESTLGQGSTFTVTLSN